MKVGAMENYLTGYPCDCCRTTVPASQSRDGTPAVHAGEAAQVSPPLSVSDTGESIALSPENQQSRQRAENRGTIRDMM